MGRPPLTISERLRRELQAAIDSKKTNLAEAAFICGVNPTTLFRFMAQDDGKPATLKLGTADKLAAHLGCRLIAKGAK